MSSKRDTSVEAILEEAILQWYGLSDAPFPKHAPAKKVLYYDNFKQILQRLDQVLLTGEFGVVIGETGSGKTTLLSQFIARSLHQMYQVIVIYEPSSKKRELYRSISQGMGVNVSVQGADALKVVDLLKRSYLEFNRPHILLIDEAHLLSTTCLNELRILTNRVVQDHPILSLVLFGQPFLASMLQSPEMTAFAHRIHVWATLTSLNEEDALEYLQWQFKVAGSAEEIFKPGAQLLVVRKAKGNPRLICRLCWECLNQGYNDESKVITEELVSYVFKNNLGPHLD